MLPEQKLDALIARHQAVEAELSTQVSPDTYVKLSREFAELGPIVEAINDLSRRRRRDRRTSTR